MSTVVVGAGLAGLAAARRLGQQGEDVVVLEARDCIGGRTRSLRDVLLHGQPADLGASFIDLGQDLLLQICDQFGLEITPRISLVPRDPDGALTVASILRNGIVSGGKLLDESESIAIADEVRAAVDAVPPALSETMPAWLARAGLSERARAAVSAQSGFDPVDVPWRAPMSMFHPPLIGMICWLLADGTDSVAHAIGDGLDIRLEQPVRLVTRNGGKLTVETETETFTADDVVVATPIPPLLNIGFDPVLPDWKVNALLSTPMSQGGKAIAQYTRGSQISDRLGTTVIAEGPVSIVWPRPVGPEDTIVILGLLADTGDGILRDEERALAALDDVVHAVAGPEPQRLAGVLRDWTAEEFTGGVVSVSWTEHGRLTSLLGEQVGRIHFAGEQTDDMFTSGMEGALRSGLRVADEIVRRRNPAAAGARLEGLTA
jgi:monoamine oxidase